jgi:hypothetical protein
MLGHGALNVLPKEPLRQQHQCKAYRDAWRIYDCGGHDILSVANAPPPYGDIIPSPRENSGDPCDARYRKRASATGAKIGFDDTDARQRRRQSDPPAEVPNVDLKPAETPLSEVARVTIDAAVDRASGVEVFHTMLVMRTGKGWGFPAANAQDAQRKADAIRAFLGLTT